MIQPHLRYEHHCVNCGRIIKGPAIVLHTRRCRQMNLVHFIRRQKSDTPAPLTGGVRRTEGAISR